MNDDRSRTLVIDPVTRIEGHGKVVIEVDDDLRVTDARLQVGEFRGFERFVQGHPYWEAPLLLQRVCGICFVSHHLCGAKVLDRMTGAAPPPAAEKVRRLGHYAQQLQSHVTAYFFLGVPELLFGMDAPPQQRNILGLMEADPALIRRVVALRKWGQTVIQALFGKRMHGIESVPGGVLAGLDPAERERLLNGDEGLLSLDQVIDHARDGLRLFRQFHRRHRDLVDGFATVPALEMSLVGEDGNVDYYHGRIRIVDHRRRVVEEFDSDAYLDQLAEAVEPWSYMKFPYLKRLGRDAGALRVGPLARMNVTRTLSTPLAAEALEEFHAYTGGHANAMVMHTHWARAIEILHSAELIGGLLRDPDLQGAELRTPVRPEGWTGEGVATVEAPRGTLLHHYRAGPEGEITFVNLIVATTCNNAVINRTVRAVAEQRLNGREEITEGMMNAVEAGIRAYDPCLSCATHAVGRMPLQVTLRDRHGRVLDERRR